MKINIGSTIKELRLKQEITQEQLSAYLGVTPQAISRWEAGNGYPDIEILPSIAEYFSVTTDTLLGINRTEREKRLAEIYNEIKDWDECSNNFNPKEKHNEIYRLIKPALEFINLTYTNNFSIKTYADKCNLSESYFRKIFKSVIGISPIDYRNELRFAKAEQLYQTGNNLKQIAEAIGFCDEVFFSKLYKKRFGTSIKNRLKTV